MSVVSQSEPVWSAPRWPGLAKRLLRIALTLAAFGLAAVAWLNFAPTGLGGSVNYVVTDGISMLPHIRADGLVIVRAEPSYHVGEVVAYHNLQLRRVVLHRIVAIHGDRYVFKGDNNNFTDMYQPTAKQLVGKEWLYLAGAGRWLMLARNPVAFGIAFAAIGLWVGTGWNSDHGRRRRRRRHRAR